MQQTKDARGRRKNAAALVIAMLLLAFAVIAAGCGSDDKQSSSSGGDSAAGGGDAKLLAMAKKDATAATQEITSFDQWNPGPGPAPKAAKVGTVTCPFFIPACKRISDSLAEGGQAIGWDVTSLDGTPDPRKQRSAVQSLLTDKADGIVLMGFDINAVNDLVEKADSQGVKMVSEATPFEPGLPIFGDINITGGFKEAGRQLGSWVANDSKGKGKVLAFSADVNPGLVERYDGFREYLDQFPDVEFVEDKPIVIPEADVGPPLEARARAVLQSHPKGTVDYIYAPADGWATFIVNALQQSGRDEVKVVAFDGAEQNMEFIRQGQNQVATQASPWGWCGWLTIDQLNRAMQGGEFVDKGCPSKVLDKTNLPPKGELFDGDLDFKAEFKKVWGAE
ncbi:MAG TPA: sugar ABC transporter substrate-binding protein [Thermoleophilaceae bacterium]|nr:sugar ABC transporter substrate-binding protein [Thermoleophilaceae bacterium]